MLSSQTYLLAGFGIQNLDSCFRRNDTGMITGLRQTVDKESAVCYCGLRLYCSFLVYVLKEMSHVPRRLFVPVFHRFHRIHLVLWSVSFDTRMFL